MKENAKGLKLHPDDFERILTEVGFSAAEHLGKAGEGGECYLLLILRRIHDDVLKDSEGQLTCIERSNLSHLSRLYWSNLDN